MTSAEKSEKWVKDHKFEAVVMYIALCAWLWPYVFDSVFEWAGRDAEMLWWHGVLFGFVPIIGQAIIPVAFAVFVIGLFI